MFSVLKFLPVVSQIFKALDFATIILQLLGYGNWKQIIQDSKAARMELEIEELQERDERSEELNSGNFYKFEFENISIL